MKFDIIAIFPEPIISYLKESILGRAAKRGLIKSRIINPRDFAPSGRLDDRPYGGGPGMVIQPEPVWRAVKSLRVKPSTDVEVIVFSPAGKQFDDKAALRLAEKKRLVFIADRYEGLDERVRVILKKEGFKVTEISLGPYVLSGGELPTLAVIDAVSRKIRGVLGKEESLEEKRLGVGVPVYTRPAEIRIGKRKYKVPAVLLSGDHESIKAWRVAHRKKSPYNSRHEH
ncbi:MAG TPA: tRNA (guanosine(37)-N1)-methyltransferase TrmD [Candidatus Tyrphobacter sp.]|nr:tRNA (guanosine(37)-N1)-methyltransferase TrmD [Candidatus Tyrphobacter sp.]